MYTLIFKEKRDKMKENYGVELNVGIASNEDSVRCEYHLTDSTGLDVSGEEHGQDFSTVMKNVYPKVYKQIQSARKSENDKREEELQQRLVETKKEIERLKKELNNAIVNEQLATKRLNDIMNAKPKEKYSNKKVQTKTNKKKKTQNLWEETSMPFNDFFENFFSDNFFNF